MKATINLSKKFCFWLFFGFYAFNSYANEIRFKSLHEIEWWKVVSEARKQHKPIFLDFYTDWCGSCKAMDKAVLKDPGVAWRFNTSFVNVKVNAESFDGIEMAQKYQVRCFPTYIFIDDSGKLLYKSEGMASVKTFLGFAHDALDVFDWRAESNTNAIASTDNDVRSYPVLEPEKRPEPIKYPSAVKPAPPKSTTNSKTKTAKKIVKKKSSKHKKKANSKKKKKGKKKGNRR